MARMHARKRGKSASTKPMVKEIPKWVTATKDDVKTKIIELSKEGHPPAEIGLILRDQHAIPDVKLITGMSVTQILAEGGVARKIPEDLGNLMKKAVSLHDHMKDNPKDLHNKRGLHLIEAKIRRLAKYYVKEGVLPGDWSYSIETAELLIE